MHKKFVVNQIEIKGGCQSERKASERISYSKMPLVTIYEGIDKVFELPFPMFQAGEKMLGQILRILINLYIREDKNCNKFYHFVNRKKFFLLEDQLDIPKMYKED